VDRIALGLLDGSYRDGQTIRADAVGGEIVLSATKASEPAAA